TTLHKAGRDPVEQFRMVGELSPQAKIVGRTAKPLPEVRLPDPIDEHASRKRVVGPRYPAGQLQPAAVGRGNWRQIGEGSNLQIAARRAGAEIEVIAPNVDLQIG